MRYYIADLHFFHENLNTKMDKRGFANVNAMNDYMLKQWNSKVRNRDEVVILRKLFHLLIDFLTFLIIQINLQYPSSCK